MLPDLSFVKSLGSFGLGFRGLEDLIAEFGVYGFCRLAMHPTPRTVNPKP